MAYLDILSTLTYLLLAFALFFIGKMAYSLFNRTINVNHELLENDNVAFGASLVGYYAGLITAIGGAIVGPSNGMVTDIIDISIYGLGLKVPGVNAFVLCWWTCKFMASA